MLESAQRDLDRKWRRRQKPKRTFRRFEHILAPDRERLDRFLAGLLGMLNELYYRAAALFEIIPAWLRFLESRRLIDAETRARTLRELKGLANRLRRIMEGYADDPSPHRALAGWEEGKASPA